MLHGLCCVCFLALINYITASNITGKTEVNLVGDTLIKEGDTLSLNCSVDQPQITLTWTFNNLKITEEASITINSSDTTTISNLKKTNVTKSHSGNYTCSAPHVGNNTLQVLIEIENTTTPPVAPQFTGFHNVKRLQTVFADSLENLIQSVHGHHTMINNLDLAIMKRYSKLEKWLSDMELKIKLDTAESQEVMEGQQKKLHDLSEQLDLHEFQLNEQKIQLKKLMTMNLPGASLSREIEALRREMFELRSNQAVANETVAQIKLQLEQFKGIIEYLENKLKKPELVYCETDDDCKDKYYCSVTRQGNICEPKSPSGTFCLRDAKCLSNSCNWRGKCD